MSNEPGTENQGAGAGEQGAGDQGAEFNVDFNGDQGAGAGEQGAGDQGAGEDSELLNWVPESYRETFKADPSLKEFKSPEDFFKSYIEQKSTIGSMVKIPTEESTPEEWDKFYNKMGRPETPEGYELDKTLPEGLELNEDFFNAFVTEAHSTGLSNVQVQKMYNWYNSKTDEMNKNMSQIIESGYKKSMDDAVGSLKKEWGTDYETNLAEAVAMANKFLSPATRQYLNATKLGNYPDLIKDFHKLSQQVSGGQYKGQQGHAPSTSLDQLNAEMEKNLRDASYTTNPALQARNREIANQIAKLQENASKG